MTNRFQFNQALPPEIKKRVLWLVAMMALIFQITGYLWHARHTGTAYLDGMFVFIFLYAATLGIIYLNLLKLATHLLVAGSNINMLFGFTIFNEFSGFTTYFFTFLITYSLIFGIRQPFWFFFYTILSIAIFLIHRAELIFLWVDKSVIIPYDEGQETFFYITSFGMAALVLYFQASSLARKDGELNNKLAELDTRSEELKRALHEKEILLAEVYHRVKNNLSVVLSLINLQRNLVNDEKIATALLDCANRIKSMSLIHQKFYEERNFETIDLKKFVHELIEELRYAYNTHFHMETNIDIDSFYADLRTAIPLGIILNEAVTNSIKHGRDLQGRVVLSISIKPLDSGTFKMVIKDNGSGFDFSSTMKSMKSLGLVLIESLSQQIDGSFHYTTEQGTMLEIIFPLKVKN